MADAIEPSSQVNHTVDADPVAFSFAVSTPTVTVTRNPNPPKPPMLKHILNDAGRELVKWLIRTGLGNLSDLIGSISNFRWFRKPTKQTASG